MKQRRMRWAETRILWAAARAEGTNPCIIILLILANNIRRNPMVKITLTEGMKPGSEL